MNKRRYEISISEGDNQDLVSVYVDGSHEDQVYHKEVSTLLPQKKHY